MSREGKYLTGRSYKLSVLPRIGTVRGIFTPLRVPQKFKDEAFETLQEVMEARFSREQSILSSSPHKRVVNAVRYARAVNMTLAMGLEKNLNILYSEFEQEFRRIIEVQNDIIKEYPNSFQLKERGFTRRQFRHHVNETLELKRRAEDLERMKTFLSLPARSVSLETDPRRSGTGMRAVTVQSAPSPWKHDVNIVYLPPI